MAENDNFREFKDIISSALVGTTRIVGQISNEDLAFHRSSNPLTGTLIERQNTRLLKLAHGLTKAATWGTDVAAPHLANADSVDENWKSIVDVFDSLLEKADACLDEFTGSIKRLSPDLEEQIKKAAPAQRKHRQVRSHHLQDIKKPQLFFNNVPKNNENTPFRPLLQSKPHSIVPLEESLSFIDSDDVSKQYKHPYETEIKKARYPPSTFVRADPIPYKSFSDTKATFVDTPQGVAVMLTDLLQAKEISIDLEHHDEHSYTGLVSLMQISTRTKDWVIDTLKPWRRDLQVLNEVFTDPSILKVLHGAFMDVIWLQRDLGLYLVNLFDTFHASRALSYPQKSLAYLLKTFANVDAAKQFQMADWRIRPLPEELFNYARSDTHYLLYIFDSMRNALIDKSALSESGENLVETVMMKSKDVALQRYERHFYDFERGSGPTGWYNMLCRTPALFTREQFAVFRAVHQWRDGIARHEDESVQLVMPKHVLYNIAREIPMDNSSLLGCSHPMSKVFQKWKEDLLAVVKRAKARGATGPDMKELMQDIDPLPNQSTRVTSGPEATTSNSVKTDTMLVNSVQRVKTTLALRSDNSRFWGAYMSNATSTGTVVDHQYHSLTLPLPQMTADVFDENDRTSQPLEDEAKPSPSPLVENQSVKNDLSKSSEMLILRDDGGSRKRKAATDLEGTAAHEAKEYNTATFRPKPDFSVDQNSEAQRKYAKAERKAEKKRLKEAKREEGHESVTHGNEVSEPFDYANAPSMLRAKQNGADPAATPSQGFNPYAKSIDAPKGMRKSKKEVPGKSHTFKA